VARLRTRVGSIRQTLHAVDFHTWLAEVVRCGGNVRTGSAVNSDGVGLVVVYFGCAGWGLRAVGC
jgi:hypothetical protein